MLTRGKIAGFTLAAIALLPTPATAADPAVGRARFSVCGACHGLQGQGNRELAAPRIAGLPTWYVGRQLRAFRTGSRGGPSSDRTSQQMAVFARNLGDADVDDLAAYVASLPASAGVDATLGLDAAPAAFQQCAACHGATGEGSESLGAPPLHNLNAWYFSKQLYDFKARIRGYDADDTMAASMGAIAQSIDTKETADAVAAYLHLTD